MAIFKKNLIPTFFLSVNISLRLSLTSTLAFSCAFFLLSSFLFLKPVRNSLFNNHQKWKERLTFVPGD
jgi:hypothetical protein